MLLREVLARLAEADGGEAELVVGGVIAASSKSIGPRHRPHFVRRHVTAAPSLNESRERSRRRILGSFGIHANRRAVDDAVAASIAADDVVVEHGLDRNLL